MMDTKYTPQDLAHILAKTKPYLVDIEKLIHSVPYGTIEIQLELATYGGHVVRMTHISRSDVKYKVPRDDYRKAQEAEVRE